VTAPTVSSLPEYVVSPLIERTKCELWLTGTFRYANYPAAIGLAAAGRVDVAALITGHYGLDDTENALLAGRNDAASIKVMVHPRTAS
jgi:L-iditol 2-dehydrogenase